MHYRSSVSYPYDNDYLGKLEGVFRNGAFPHFYEIYRVGHSYTAVSVGKYKSRLQMSQSEYLDFCRTLIKNGWKESPPVSNI